MPAKTKVTKEMIIDAAFAIAREEGAENINARTVLKRLHCSTQPVMYHFATIEELRKSRRRTLRRSAIRENRFVLLLSFFIKI